MILRSNNIYAVIFKTIKDLLKNKVMFIINFMFPFLAILFKIAFPPEESCEPILSFCTMNVVMIPILIMSSIIAEEKEKGTLRALISINVKPIEYLLGVSLVTFTFIFISSSFFLYLIKIPQSKSVTYLLYCSLSAVISILIGATIGLCAQNQVKVGASAAPISMLIGLLPVFSGVNKYLDKIAGFFYSSILADFLIGKGNQNHMQDYLVCFINLLIVLGIFLIIFRKKGLCE